MDCPFYIFTLLSTRWRASKGCQWRMALLDPNDRSRYQKEDIGVVGVRAGVFPVVFWLRSRGKQRMNEHRDWQRLGGSRANEFQKKCRCTSMAKVAALWLSTALLRLSFRV